MSEAMPYYQDEMCCAVCAQPLTRFDRQFAMVWIDPTGQSCIAHAACLIRLGEQDLGLRGCAGPDPTHERPGPA